MKKIALMLLAMTLFGCATTDEGIPELDWMTIGATYHSEYGSISFGGGQSKYGNYYPYYNYAPYYPYGYGHYPYHGTLPPRPPGTYGPYHGVHHGPIPVNCFIDYHFNSYTLKCNP